MLADHIAIVYKGKLVCEGPTTALKARYGDSYIIRNDAITEDEDDDDNMVWRTSNSAEATRKLLELENLDNDNNYNVQFPTLEQVFLKVTSDTAIHGNGGDGYVGSLDTAAVIVEKIYALENDYATDIELDVGNGTTFFRQVVALFNKRYMLLRQRTGWIGYAINLVIPIILAAAIAKFLRKFPDLETCQMTLQELQNPSDQYNPGENSPGYPTLSPWRTTPEFWYRNGSVVAYMGPDSTWSDNRHMDLYLNNFADAMIVNDNSSGYAPSTDPVIVRSGILASRSFVSKLDDMTQAITNAPEDFRGFGLWAPPNGAATIFHSTSQSFMGGSSSLTIMNLLTSGLVKTDSNGTPRRFSTMLNSFVGFHTQFQSLLTGFSANLSLNLISLLSQSQQ